jgi:hypothetical protein
MSATRRAMPFGRAGRAAAPQRGIVEALLGTIVVVGLLGTTLATVGHLSGTIALLASVGVVACAFLFLNPRLEISLAVLALYLGLLDGYLKLSTGNQLVTSARDALLYAIVAGALVRLAITRARVQLPKYTAHVVLLAGLVVVQAFNPGTPGAKAAFGGLRQQLEFVPLLFLGFALMRTERRLKAFLVLMIVIAAANSAVALVQYNMSPEQIAAWGPGYSAQVLGTGAFNGAARNFADASGDLRTRPFGLGSDSGVSGTLGWMAVAGALALIAARAGRRWVLFGAAGVLVCAVGIFASQSRSALFAGVFALVAFATLSVTSREATRAFAALLIGGLLIYAGVTTFLSNNGGNASSRFGSLRPGNIAQTIGSDRGSSLSLTPGYFMHYPLGVGLGRSGPASGFGGGISELNAENEPNLLIGEIGAVGLIVFAALWLRVVFDSIRAVRRTTTMRVRMYLAAVSAPLLAMTLIWLASSPTTSVPAAPFFWFTAGVVAWAVHAGDSAFAPNATSPRRVR